MLVVESCPSRDKNSGSTACFQLRRLGLSSVGSRTTGLKLLPDAVHGCVRGALETLWQGKDGRLTGGRTKPADPPQNLVGVNDCDFCPFQNKKLCKSKRHVLSSHHFVTQKVLPRRGLPPNNCFITSLPTTQLPWHFCQPRAWAKGHLHL